jgi:hypothetical protein
MESPEHVTLEKHLELLDQHREALEIIADLRDQLSQAQKVFSIVKELNHSILPRVITVPAPIKDQLHDAVWSAWSNKNEQTQQIGGS